MKYYLIAGEASGDLHASRLMRSLKQRDAEAEFRFFGGDRMAAEGGTMVHHYRDLAYMGFIPVLLHLRTIMRGMEECKRDIVSWMPHVVILIDYAGFNLSIAEYIKENTGIPVHYYIAPKLWAWKEYRIKYFKQYVDHLYSIMPHEVDFFEGKHKYPMHYVGNPTQNEVDEFKATYRESREDFCRRHGLSSKPIIALLAGSRRQEIKDNLPYMIEASRRYRDYQLVLAGAPGIETEYYNKYIKKGRAEQSLKIVSDDTYALLSHATAALVTSGTATLETALFSVPQVVCYRVPLPWLAAKVRPLMLKIKYISLVNIIADKEIVTELVEQFTPSAAAAELAAILPGTQRREAMLRDYEFLRSKLGTSVAPDNAADWIIESIRNV